MKGYREKTKVATRNGGGYAYAENDDWLYEEVGSYDIEPARDTLEEIRSVVGLCNNKEMTHLLIKVENYCVAYARVVKRFRDDLKESSLNVVSDKINTERTSIHDKALENLGDLLEMIEDRGYKLTTSLGKKMQQKIDGIADKYRSFFGYHFMIMVAFILAEESQE